MYIRSITYNVLETVTVKITIRIKHDKKPYTRVSNKHRKKTMIYLNTK